ncbi:MAG: VPDSG-CTERM sorting domain-containing protein [Planctomycetia bacterium]|nr:VPDSG-CTERM sorting domain-containing protein [Planctomycetia bacterium]
MRKLIPLLAIMLMAGPALVAPGLAATYTDNFNGANPQQWWAVQDEAGNVEVWSPGGLVTADSGEFTVSYGGMAHIVDGDLVDPTTPLFLGSILASFNGATVAPIPYSGGVTVHGRVNAGSILTGHGLAIAAMFGPGDGGSWNFYTMNIAPWWHDISIGCYHNTTTWFRLDDWSQPVPAGLPMWTNPIDLTMQIQAMPNTNVSFVGVAYGDLADGLGYRKICELSAEVGATIPDQYQVLGVTQPQPWYASDVPKLTAGGVGFGGGVEGSWLLAGGGGQNVTFDNFQSWDPLPGDANIDGVVDDKDASALGKNWQVQTGATWFMGDFNFDGKVDDEDAAILAAHYGQSAGVGSVPEPSTAVLLLGLALAGLAAWRRR